jgi:hypothetical protein
MILVWDSKDLDGVIEGGCMSETLVVVHQIKSSHLINLLKRE